MEVFKGPMGTHRNYLTYIALDNCVDYYYMKNKNQEADNPTKQAKYKELRLFLNAIISLNNILDFYYYENEDNIIFEDMDSFKNYILDIYSELNDLSEMVKEYLECAKLFKSGSSLAKNIKRPSLNVDFQLGQKKINVEYDFNWPLPDHDEKLTKAFQFWHRYYKDPHSKALSHA